MPGIEKASAEPAPRPTTRREHLIFNDPLAQRSGRWKAFLACERGHGETIAHGKINQVTRQPGRGDDENVRSAGAVSSTSAGHARQAGAPATQRGSF